MDTIALTALLLAGLITCVSIVAYGIGKPMIPMAVFFRWVLVVAAVAYAVGILSIVHSLG